MRPFLTMATATDGQTWICPWCADHETYRRLGEGEPARVGVEAAIALCRFEFGVADDGLRTTVWLGDHPECVHDMRLGGYNVYLSRGANALQHAYSGAHEAFHRVCTPNNARHWAHEMLAVLFSLRCLDSFGNFVGAQMNRVSLEQEAASCDLEQLLDLGAGPYPNGTYGRAYILGAALVDAIGWDLLKSLALARDEDGMPSVETWLDSLPPTERGKALVILAGAS